LPDQPLDRGVADRALEMQNPVVGRLTCCGVHVRFGKRLLREFGLCSLRRGLTALRHSMFARLFCREMFHAYTPDANVRIVYDLDFYLRAAWMLAAMTSHTMLIKEWI
jgi:hypothetical protein